jgi:hypothetical protein
MRVEEGHSSAWNCLLVAKFPQPSLCSPAPLAGSSALSRKICCLYPSNSNSNIPHFIPSERPPHNNMATNSQDDPKPDGAAFDDFFDSIGKKAENLNLIDQTGKKDSATQDSVSKTLESTTEDDEPKVVDEIESLCMNCRENV